ncbi:DUF4192 domain-containing protein [Kitasatospora sp. NPDC057692]|uniref:DUF4192 domain-containing protein n=1 Tax=Kitasatospora sp. NPDC057692 TaxID=3346215 RepID=UPI003687347F
MRQPSGHDRHAHRSSLRRRPRRPSDHHAGPGRHGRGAALPARLLPRRQHRRGRPPAARPAPGRGDPAGHPRVGRGVAGRRRGDGRPPRRALRAAGPQTGPGPPLPLPGSRRAGAGGRHGPPVAERLRPLAERLQQAFEGRGVRVKESLCVSAGRWSSFLCTRQGCCDPAGHPIRRTPGPGPVAVAATVAGLAPRGSRREILAGLAPVGPPAAEAVRSALARAGARPAPGRRPSIDRRGHEELLDAAVAEFMAGATALDDDRAARLLLALQDRIIRDRAAEYARPDELASVQRLWRFLATRCVAPYESCAAPPLTLLAWASWVAGDDATARVVLGHTLRHHPSYLLAQLLYESLNGGFAPDTLLASVEEERRRRTGREERERASAEASAEGESAEAGPPSAPPPPVPAAGGGVPGTARRRGRRRRGRPVTGAAEAEGAATGGAGAGRASEEEAGPDRPSGAPPGRSGTGAAGGGGSTGARTARVRCRAAGTRAVTGPTAGCRPPERPRGPRATRIARPVPRPSPSPAGGCRWGRFRGARGAGAERHGR